jgi:hypothetical protein
VLVSTQRSYATGDEGPGDGRAEDLARALIVSSGGVGLVSTVAIRREAFDLAGGFDATMEYSEDLDLFRRLALVGPMVRIRAATVERGFEPDSLWQRGQRTGGNLLAAEHSMRNVLTALEASSRVDAADLRARAMARRSTVLALRALSRREPIATVRLHLADAFSRSPDLARHPLPVLRQAGAMPNRERREDRALVLAKLFWAWPNHSPRAMARLAGLVVRQAASRRL